MDPNDELSAGCHHYIVDHDFELQMTHLQKVDKTHLLMAGDHTQIDMLILFESKEYSPVIQCRERILRKS